MTRLALAIAYDGTRFDSYARQPDRRTVEGELLRVLAEAGAFQDPKKAWFASGSRTDAGVSAAQNVVAFNTRMPPGAVVAATVRAPEGLHLLAAVPVRETFDPRHARSRTYRYFLPEKWNWKRLSPVARAFLGEHDFTNFRRADPGKGPLARISRIHYHGRGPMPYIEITAPAFLWQQVRRMVAAFEGVSERRLTTSIVREALFHPDRRVDLGIAAPENLLLVRVDYADLAFPATKGVAADRLARERRAIERRAAWAAAVA